MSQYVSGIDHPAEGEGQTVCETSCPIDLVHLARQSLGDSALETELLHLFAAQADQILAALRRCGEAQQSLDLAHRLKGSARAIGAGAVARAAESCEAAAKQGRLPDARLAELAQAIEQAQVAIQRLVA
jgi:HPt (histidine-containing phosphotransfer) domain-containing protein